MKRWLMCVAGLAFGLVLLHRLGTGELHAPPLGSVDEFRAWVDGRDGAVVAMALLRLVAIVGGWWLLVLALLDGAARVADLRPLQHLSERVTPAAFRELLGAGAGAGMASMAALGVFAPPPPVASPAQPAAAQDSSVIMRQLSADEPAPTTPTTVVMRVIEEEPPPAPVAAPAPDEATWIVRPGESFWAIAVEQLADDLGRPPTDREIIAYWTELIDANRANLADPSNPDLLFPGQVLAIPAFSTE